MAIQKTEAIVLRTQPFRSSSMIVTFFTRDFGKIRGILKGVRDEKQNRSAAFELFTRLEIVYYEKTRSDLHLVSEFFVLDSFGSLRSCLDGIGYASYFVELVDRLSEVHDPHPAVFDLLEFSFRFLGSLKGERVSRIFQIKLLNEIGWLPFLRACIECGNSKLETGFFSPRHGVLICEPCAGIYTDAMPISPECLRSIHHTIRHPHQEAIKHSISAKAEKDLYLLLRRFLMDRLDRPLKSSQFLEQIKVIQPV